jgi:predicted metal-dependent phosphoesterase TrpH
LLKVDFHTHTYHSYDCIMQPARILQKARERGLTHIVINDHNTISGGLDCKKIQEKHGIEVIVGSEIHTDVGDITGIYLKEEIAAGPYLDVITKIKNQGGLVILNHPFVQHNLSNVNFEAFDLIEGYNGRCNTEQNAKANALAKAHGLPVIAGSDAHTYSEIGTTFCSFETLDFKNSPRSISYHKTHSWNKIVSQLIKGFKRKDVLLIAKVLASSPRKLLTNR